MSYVISPIEEKILTKLGQLDARYSELEARMNDPLVASNPTEFIRVSKEHAKLRKLVECYRRYGTLRQQCDEAQAMLDDPAGDSEMRDLARQEREELEGKLTTIMEEAKGQLVMSDDAAIGAVIMEIRAGTGGEEAALFAGDLYRMYNKYCENRGWKVEAMDLSPSDMGGFREVILSIKGEGVWQALGYEGGGHRVQRVPETEAQGRIHTSAATVAVLPEAEEVDVEIKPDDVLEHVSCAGGPGGQNVNKVATAIRLEHIPTGITVSMRDERSQHKNRAKAWRILRSRIFDYTIQKKRAERDSARKTMIGSGDRSERIRTYNFPQNRLTDHRINLSLYTLDKIVDGNLDDLVNALIDYDKHQRLENL